LAVCDRNEATYVDRVASTYPTRMHSTIGYRNPVHRTSLRKTIVAWVSAEERKRLRASSTLETRTATTMAPSALASRQPSR
jgi:DNA-binding IclR family transcriptional regulator